MDKQVRNQMIGAFVWFVALVIVSGYLQPVSFDPFKQVDRVYDPNYRSPLARLFDFEGDDAERSERAGDEALASEEGGASGAAAAPVVQDKAALEEQKKGKLTYDKPLPEGWILRLASFRKADLAQNLMQRAKKAGYAVFVHPFVNSKKEHWYAVDIVRLKSRKEALTLKRRLDRRFNVRSEIFHNP